jgi:hypothetical protein
VTKITIELEDIADKKACAIAIRKLFAALETQHGEREASRMWNRHGEFDLTSPKWTGRFKLQEALRDLPDLEQHDLRLVLEYFAMSKPSKRGLAKELARRNVGLNEKWRAWVAERRGLEAERADTPWPNPPSAPYGPKGTTNWKSMQTRIKNIFRDYPETCAVYAAAPPEIRQDELERLESSEMFSAMNKALGVKPSWRIGRKRKSRGK